MVAGDCLSELCTAGRCTVDRCPLASDGQIALYTVDGDLPAGPLTDSVGTHDGMLRGTLTSTPGPDGCGDAVAFPSIGAGDPYVEIPDSSDWDLASGSIDFWFRLDALPPAGAGVVGRDAINQALNGHLTVFVNSDGYVIARLQRTAVPDRSHLCSDGPLVLGAWTRVTLNWGAPRAELWIDGVLATNTGDVVNNFDMASPTISCGGDWTDGIDGNDNPWVLGAASHRSVEGSATPIDLPLRDAALDHFHVNAFRF